jgi:hypothetical protein
VESQTISRATATTEARNDEMDHRETKRDPREDQNGDRVTTVRKRARAGGEGRTPAYVVRPYHYALTGITTEADTGLVTQGWVGDKPCMVRVYTGEYVHVARPDIAAGCPERQPKTGLALQTVSGEALPILI